MNDNNKNERVFVNLKAKASRLATVSLLFDSLQRAQSPQYVASINVDKNLREAGTDIGRARDRINQYRGQHPSQKRKMDVHSEGATSELLLALMFEDFDSATIAALVAHKPVKSSDYTIKGVVMDAKTVRQASTAINVNWLSHHNPKKRPQYYLLAHFSSEFIVDLYVLEAATIDSWTLVDTEWDGSKMDDKKKYYKAPLDLLPVPLKSSEPYKFQYITKAA